MPRRALNFSLGTLLIAAIGLSALLGGILTLNRNAALYEKQRQMTSDQLYDIAWRIRAHMDQTQSEFYPPTLENFAATGALNISQLYFTNPRFAELDEAFVTISGLKRQDGHCIWLYENLPDDENSGGRFALVVQGEALVPVWMPEATFREELRETLKRPNTKTVLNNRKASAYGWPVPGATIEAGRMVIDRCIVSAIKSSAGQSTQLYYFNIRQKPPAVPIILFAISTLAALTLFVRSRRAEQVTA